MEPARAEGPPISVLARLGSGVLLPMALFVLWQGLLISFTTGHGSWAGMTVFFSSLVTVPALAVLDLWVLAVRWRAHFPVFVAGLALPAAFGALEALVMFRSGRTIAPLESAFEKPLAPFVAIAFLVPLISAVAVVIGRWWRGRRSRARGSGPSWTPERQTVRSSARAVQMRGRHGFQGNG